MQSQVIELRFQNLYNQLRELYLNHQLQSENTNYNWRETERHRMYPEVTTENGWKKVAYYFPNYAKRPRKRQRIK